MITVLLAAATIVGAIPARLTASRVVWFDGRTGNSVTCDVALSAWRCDGLPEPPHGIVAMIGDTEVAVECIATCGQGDARARQWGRLMLVSPGGVAPADLRDLQVTAWRPEQSAFRTASRRVTATRDTDVDVVPVSDVAFWIAGNTVNPAAYLSVDGAAVGSVRVAVGLLAAGPPDAPFFLPASLPFSLSGRVQGASFQGIAGVDVQLFEPLVRDDVASAGTATGERPPMVLLAETRSDDDGDFAFERLAPGSYLVEAFHATAGRGSARVRSLAEPLIVRLDPPVRARGRVLQHQLPVSGARVRFVPAPEAFIKNENPIELIAPDTVTDNDGRFVLALPRVAVGNLQVVGSDGVSTRVSVSQSAGSREVLVGDITLSDPRGLRVRMLEGEACSILAAGPLGALGLTVIRGYPAGYVHWFEVPEAGEWALEAECQGQSVEVDPRIVTVPARGPDTTVDVRLVR